MSQAWDLFFYYGKANSDDETRQDIINGLGTSKNKLFYNRSDSAGINDYENNPIGFAFQVGSKFNIIKWLSYRNTYTGDGKNGKKERRIATSQNQIEVILNKTSIDINVFYILFNNINKNNTLTVPVNV